MKRKEIEAFVRHLEALRDGKVDETATEAAPLRPDRAALSMLRRALSGEERDVLPAYQHLNWYLPPYPEEQKRCVLIAALFADHQGGTSQGTLGDHLAALVRVDPGKQAVVTRRFTQLLTAHADELPMYLRQLISLLKGAGIPINWIRLLSEVLYWEKDGERVRQKWAYDFWGPPAKTASLPDTDALLTDDISVVTEELLADEADSFEADY